MDAGAFNARWDEEGVRGVETIVPDADTEQAAAENLMFLAQDMMGNYGDEIVQMEHMEQIEQMDGIDQIECQITEEVITDDWVEPGGQERVELAVPLPETPGEGDALDVPLPTDQDEYTAMRPYPCDFCSRRFRKKANLMNHMVMHQNDRPYGCNLCGARYVRRCDLLNHLKVHAFVPEDAEEEIILPDPPPPPPKRHARKPKSPKESDKTAVAARTQKYEGSGAVNAPFSPPVRIRYEASDPSRPFVCQHCGVGFAREKALASHSRVHGGDSPVDCRICGEVCWRDSLMTHMRTKHPNRVADEAGSNEELVSEDSPQEDEEEDDEGSESWVELVCKDCGAGFQRADLLQRHVRAAHSHLYAKKDPIEDFNNSKESEDTEDNNEDENWNGQNHHACSVCGESFRDALQLLAHAESHARGRNNRCVSCGEKFADRATMVEHITFAHPDLPPNTCLFCGRTCADERALEKHIASQHESPDKMLFCSKCGKSFRNKARLKRHMASHRDKAVTCAVCGESFADGRSLMNHRHSHKGTPGRQFPCQECGKTFGSRSSQQIHIRIHTGERPYGCRFCWKAFADGGTLRKHERIHTGEKPYACAICPRAFNQRVVLREHVRSHHSGPDVRHGTAITPYWCPVCERLMATSGELVVHIIQHCDNNTAMKRQPQVGPRKYKRRRKLSPLNIKMESDDNNSTDSEISENNKTIPVRKTKERPNLREKKRSPNVQMGAVEPEMNAEGSARTKGKIKSKGLIITKPKMIHTEKTKPSEGEGAMTRRRARSNITTITTTTTTMMMEERVRPRTKNVSYHDGVERLPAATFPSSVKPEPQTNDIADDLRAILREQTVREETRASTSRMKNVKCEASDDSVDESMCTIKEEMVEDMATMNQDGIFRCEMCCESFTMREQLLSHCRIHI